MLILDSPTRSPERDAGGEHEVLTHFIDIDEPQLVGIRHREKSIYEYAFPSHFYISILPDAHSLIFLTLQYSIRYLPSALLLNHCM
jgi:hypothetical protein